jgi:uncharacterized membrane protein YozB (DUF420 family)
MSSDPMTFPALRATRKARTRFFGLMALFCALVVFIGFAPSFYLRGLSDRPPLSLTIQLHGLVFTLWIVLFAAQSWLVRLRRVDLHRKFGVAGTVLAVATVYFAMAVAIPNAREFIATGHRPLGFSPEQFLFLQVGDMFQFAALVALAVVLRRRPEAHKRLMLLATLSILAPAIGRMPLAPMVKFAAPMVAVLLCMAFDLVRSRRIHPAFLWGGIAFIAATPLRVAIGATTGWAKIAHWMVG